MAVIVDGCKAGLRFTRPAGSTPLNVLVMSYAVNVAALLQPFAPATD